MKKALLISTFIQSAALLMVIDFSVCSRPTFEYVKLISPEQQAQLPSLNSKNSVQEVCADMITSQLAEILIESDFLKKLYDHTDKGQPAILLDECFIDHLNERQHVEGHQDRSLLVFEEQKKGSNYTSQIINSSGTGQEALQSSSYMKLFAGKKFALTPKYNDQTILAHPRLYDYSRRYMSCLKGRFYRSLAVIKGQ